MKANAFKCDQENGEKLQSQTVCLPKRVKRKKSQKVVLPVQLPIFRQYLHIDLQKTSSYQRISRVKPKNPIDKHRQLLKSEQGENKQTHWKSSIQTYIQVKQQSLNKYDDLSEYPLMKLSKKNELIRKIKTNQRFSDQKPEFIKELQSQELFQEKSLEKRKNLPKIGRIKHLQRNQRNSIQETQFNRQRTVHNSSTQILNKQYSLNSKRSSFHEEKARSQKKSFFNQTYQKANQSEKVLIGFIGNYFKQKFCPQKRFSFQRSAFEHKDDILQLSIKTLFRPKKPI